MSILRTTTFSRTNKVQGQHMTYQFSETYEDGIKCVVVKRICDSEIPEMRIYVGDRMVSKSGRDVRVTDFSHHDSAFISKHGYYINTVDVETGMSRPMSLQNWADNQARIFIKYFS